MRLRNVPEAKGIVANSPFVIQNPFSRRGHWKDTVKKPLFLEIGMGKGRYVIESAMTYPEYEYLGMERYESVLYKACVHLEKMDREEVPGNVHFLDQDAKRLPEMFAEGEVDRIYLNFSDPWPKARHARRRLTSRDFLSLYEKVLKEGGELQFKTDNVDLFDFSLEEITAAPNWELQYVTRDLHHDPELSAGNIMTEYEQKFSEKGNVIMKLGAVYRPR